MDTKHNLNRVKEQSLVAFLLDDSEVSPSKSMNDRLQTQRASKLLHESKRAGIPIEAHY